MRRLALNEQRESRGEPPPAATWLLARFGCGPAIESLAGDLVEEFHHGRSRAWYWRQTLAGIATSFAEDVIRHRLIVLQAILTGWTALFLFGWLVGDPMFEWLDTLAAARPMMPRVYPPMVVGSVGYVMCGWMIARLYRSHRAAAVIAFLACALVLQLPRLCDLVVDALGHPRYLPYLSGHLAGMILTIVSVLFGGFGLPCGRASKKIVEAD